MALVQSDGSTSVGLGVADNSTVNNGGVIRHAGNVASDRNVTSKDLGTLSGASDVHVSTPTSGTNVTRAVKGDNPTFGMNRGNAQVRMVGHVNYDSASTNRNGFTVAGESVAALRGGASDFGVRKNVQALETIRTTHTATAIRNGRWVAFSGSWDLSDGAVPTSNSNGLWDSEQNAAAGNNADFAASGLGRPDLHGGLVTLMHGSLGRPTNARTERTTHGRTVYKPKHGTTS